MNPWIGLAESLAGTPLLPGARCTNQAPLFDLDIDGETPEQQHTRHTYAINECHACPALDACRAWAPTEHQLFGVVAGEVHTAPRRFTYKTSTPRTAA